MTDRIAYSCVVDKTPQLYWEILVWIDALTQIAGVAADDLFVHVISGVHRDVCDLIRTRQCNVVPIDPFDARHVESNKLQQMKASTFKGYDAVAFTDTDLEILKPFEWANAAPFTVSGVPVFHVNPTTSSWPRLLGCAEFVKSRTIVSDKPTYHNNLNGGLYIVPLALLEELGQRARTIAREGIAGERDWDIREREVYADQIAVALALNQMRLLAHLLPREMNLPPFDLVYANAACAIHGMCKTRPAYYLVDGRHAWVDGGPPSDKAALLDDIMLSANVHKLGAPYFHFRKMSMCMSTGSHAEALAAAMLATELRLRPKDYRTIAHTLFQLGHIDEGRAILARRYCDFSDT